MQLTMLKKFICLILTLFLIIPFSAGCVVGLQGNVTITINYLDGTKTTISGHRKFDATGDSESIYTKMGSAFRYSTNEVGKVVVYEYADGSSFNRESVYQFENGKKIELFEKLENKSYHVKFYAICPGTTNSQTFDKYYHFGDELELEEEIENLLTFETVPEHFDRYAFEKWQIVKFENGKQVYACDFNFNGTFNEDYDEHFENAKVKNEYGNYVMEVKAIYKADTYNVVLNFEHDGVKKLNVSVSPVTLEVPFNATHFGLSEFKTYVKEENIEFECFSTDMHNKVLLPSVMDASQNGKTVNVYAFWSRYKTIKIDFLNGKGAINVSVYEDKYENFYRINPIVIDRNALQNKTLIGFTNERDGYTRILNLYETCVEGVTYYPIYA